MVVVAARVSSWLTIGLPYAGVNQGVFLGQVSTVTGSNNNSIYVFIVS